MTVAALRYLLDSFPAEMEVFICQIDDEFANAPLETVAVRRINFDDGANKKAASYDCLVLTDET